MNRRKFIRTMTSALIYTVCGSTSEGKDDTHKDTRPSILFIMTDQQHAGMMSCTGNKWLKTPAMDSLAREGARFERFELSFKTLERLVLLKPRPHRY